MNEYHNYNCWYMMLCYDMIWIMIRGREQVCPVYRRRHRGVQRLQGPLPRVVVFGTARLPLQCHLLA
jgi:hypothetical protein